MNRVGISEFIINERSFFDCRGRFESSKFHIFHHLDRNGLNIELDNESNFEDALTDIIEWAFKLGQDSRVLTK